MASITNVTIGVGATAILTAATSRSLGGPLYLKNESTEIITLTIAGADTYALDPGEVMQVLPGQTVTGTALGGSAKLQVVQGLLPADESASKGAGSSAASPAFVTLTDADADLLDLLTAAAVKTGATIILPTQPLDGNGKPITGGGGRTGQWSTGEGDFTAVYASATTITLGAFPTALGTPADEQFQKVVSTTVAGVQTEWKPTGNGMTLSGAVLTVALATFNASDTFDVFVAGPPKSYDGTTNSEQGQRLNPEWAHVSPDQQSDTGQTDGTKYFYWDLETYPYWTANIVDTAGAAGSNLYTFEVSPQNDGTAQGSVSPYKDKTLEYFGKASWTSAELAATPADSLWELDVPKGLKFVRIKRVRTGDTANNDGGTLIDAIRS